MQTLEDKQILAALISRRDFHRQQAAKYDAAIELFQEDANIPSLSGQRQPLNGTGLSTAVRVEEAPAQKPTFESVIIDILTETGRAMGTKDLFETYKTRTGRSELSQKDFSSKLAMRIKNGRIRNVAYRDLPVTHRYWWGLTQWAAGEDFMPEYRPNIPTIEPIFK